MSNEGFNKRRSENRKKRRQAELFVRLAIAVIILLIVLIVVLIATHLGKKSTVKDVTRDATETETEQLYVDQMPDLDVELLTPNEYSRPQIALEEVNGIVIHWTANPGTTAIQNRNYFEGLQDASENNDGVAGNDTAASAHFIVGLDGEIVQCIPCNEISYASNDRNYDTISIECCTPDETGKFNGNTYESLLKLTTWLMGRYELTTDDVIRHYDVTGKDCPKYYVDNPTAWEAFKEDLKTYIEENGVARSSTEIEEE